MTDIKRSIIKRLLRGASKSPATTQLSLAGLKLMGLAPAQIRPLESNAAAKLQEVFDASENQVSKPRRLGSPVHLYTHALKPIRPLLFNNVEAQSGSSLLNTDQWTLVPQHAYDNQERVRIAYGMHSEYAGWICTKRSPLTPIEKGICAFGQGDANWYHWIAEFIPVVLLSQRLPAAYKDFPLLVPQAALDFPSFKDILDLCRGDRSVIVLQDNQQYRVNQLVYIPPPVSGPFNMHDNQWPEPGDYIQNIGVMHLLRDTVLTELGIRRTGDSPRKVFLARRPGARSYNQDEIIAAAVSRGFEPVRMETLTFREQVQLIHNADYVAGPTGAAFTNALFMKPGSRSLCWALREYEGACFFSNLAHVADSCMHYCFVEADQKVTNSHEAFGASYTLPVETFCHHLDTLLNEPALT